MTSKLPQAPMTEQSRTPASPYEAILRWLPVVRQYLGSAGSLTFVFGSQLVTFMFLARHLGDVQYGQLMAITATTQIAMSLCGLGADEPMVRRLVRDPSLYPILLGHNLILISASGLGLTVISIVGLYFTVPIPIQSHEHLMMISIFALSNIILFRCISLTEAIFIGRREYMWANAIVVTFAALRALTALVATLVFKVDTLQTWAFWHGASHLVGVLGCAMALRTLGAPRWHVMRDEVKRGIHVIIPNFLNSLRQNVDLIVLSWVAAPGIVGNYGAASRIVQTSLMTVWSFNRIMYPRLVIAGAQGCAPTFKLASRYVLIAGGLGGLTSISLFLLSPYVAEIFGRGFIYMATYLKILCWVVFLSAVQSVAYDSLGAVEKHGLRALISNVSSVLGVGLVVGLTYTYGVNGTFVALFISQILSLAGVWIALFHLSRSESFIN
jgi:O-antigen/teichoic acid export membrane protein